MYIQNNNIQNDFPPLNPHCYEVVEEQSVEIRTNQHHEKYN
jgi:hypothetical protein